MHADDAVLLERDSWLASLAPARRAAIVRQLHYSDLVPGTHIYRIGDPPNGMHLVLKGKVRLASYTAGGRELVELIAPVFWLGQLSVIDGLDRPNDATADTPVRLGHLGMAAIAALTGADPGLWRDIARLGCMHQRLVMSNMAIVQTRSTRQRLAELLLRHAADSPDAVVRMTQEHLSEVVGISRQHTNALLADLQALGLARTGYRSIAIDPARLRRFLAALKDDSDAGGRPTLLR